MSVLDAMSNSATKELQLSKIMNIEVEDIERNPRNTAPMNYLSELEALIKVNGIIEPIVVYKVANHLYRLISGERRYTVAKKLGFETLPALIVETPEDEIQEDILITLYNVQRPDDIQTMREKISRLKSILERKRERKDSDVDGIRTTDWIAQQLGGVSARTIQEYLTGKYSEGYVDSLLSEGNVEETSKKKKTDKPKKLSKIVKQMGTLRKSLEENTIEEVTYNRKDIIDFEYECQELFIYLKNAGEDIEKLKNQLDDKFSKAELLREYESQLTLDDSQ